MVKNISFNALGEQMENRDKICENCAYMKLNYFGLVCDNSGSEYDCKIVKWYFKCDKFKEETKNECEI